MFDQREFCNSHPYIISVRRCLAFPESLAQLSSIYFRHRVHGFSDILLASDFYVNWDSRNSRFPYTALVIEKNVSKHIPYNCSLITNAHFLRTPQHLLKKTKVFEDNILKDLSMTTNSIPYFPISHYESSTHSLRPPVSYSQIEPN